MNVYEIVNFKQCSGTKKEGKEPFVIVYDGIGLRVKGRGTLENLVETLNLVKVRIDYQVVGGVCEAYKEEIRDKWFELILWPFPSVMMWHVWRRKAWNNQVSK